MNEKKPSRKHENPSLRSFINRTKRYQERKANPETFHGSPLIQGTKISIQDIEGLELKRPIEFLVLRDEELWILQNKELSIRAWGKNAVELDEHLVGELNFLKEEIWNEKDVHLAS